MAIEDCEDDPPAYAFVGVRSCELHAIAIQDRVMAGGEYPDPFYAARRDGALLVAVNCTVAGGTCFCVSMDTGPRAGSGFDIALTEVIEDGRHYFLCEAGSERGAAILAEVEQAPARRAEAEAASAAIAVAARNQGRSMDTGGIKELLYDNYEHPRWDEVSERCLTCGNCTMVCPTCFCTTVEDGTDLTGAEADRTRRWDSCFTMDFSYVHGGSVRASARSRYRQWMTHKLATWIDQFGTSGCVGCGRCITWCPVAIDITEEVAAIRADAID
jgi:ferredoxin